MYCHNCGGQVENDMDFCPTCGAKLRRLVYGTEPVSPTNPEPGLAPGMNASPEKITYANSEINPGTGNLNKNNKFNKRICLVVAGIAVVIVLAVVLSVVLLNRGRSSEKTVNSYVKAINAGDTDKLLEIMLPDNCTDTAKQKMEEQDITLIAGGIKVSSLERTDYTIAYGDSGIYSMKITDSTDLDEDTRNDFDSVLESLFGVNVQYDEISEVTLKVKYSKEEQSEDNGSKKVIMYEVGDTWYMFPGAEEYIAADKQNDDIESAQRIKTALDVCLANERVYIDISTYFGAVISLDTDFEYLPESFKSEFESSIGDMPEIKYTKGGATGYSFVIDENGSPTVYASSEEFADAWQLFPNIADSYLQGTEPQEEQTFADTNSDYSYAKLVSEDSPIIGYWQSDEAGMYIGYNASGGDEGFTVYLQPHNDDYYLACFRLLHYYSGYTMRCNNGKIRYIQTGYDGIKNTWVDEDKYKDNEEIEIEVTSEESIHVTAKLLLGDDNMPVYYDYVFEKDYDKTEVYDQFNGLWLCRGSGVIDENLGMDMSVSMDDSLGKEPNIEDGVCTGFKITLYDGVDMLHTICPYSGWYLEDDEEDYLSYSAEVMRISDGVLMEGLYTSAKPGGIDPLVITTSYAKYDSEEGQILLAIDACKDAMNEYGDMDKYAFAYIDDDDIPELVVYPTSGGTVVFTYADGQAIKIVDSSSYNFTYAKKTGYMWSGGIYGSSYLDKLENGNCVSVAKSLPVLEEATHVSDKYYLGENEVSEDEYINEVSSIDVNFEECEMYDSLYEAYSAIKSE